MLKQRLKYILLLGLCCQFTVCFAKNTGCLYSHIQVCFTPGQNCTAAINQALDNAKGSIFVQAYSFTSISIADHLIAAKKRGIPTYVILDKSQKSERYSVLPLLLNQHIPIWIDSKPAIAHNKIMIIDKKEVVTGSFNFTKAAQNKNAENLLIIQHLALANAYMKNWERRKAASDFLSPYQAPKRSKKPKACSSDRSDKLYWKFSRLFKVNCIDKTRCTP